MIVISGALVLVALVLLVLGLTMQDLDFVYGSIAVSLVSFVFLVIGILQRRGEQPAAAAPEVSDGAASTDEGTTAQPVPVAVAAKQGTSGSVPVAAPVADQDYDEDEYDEDEYEEGEPGGGTVLIVPGRPRYHVEGCRYLSGKAAEPIDVLDAQEDGFTACGVCKPDAVLEAMMAEYDEYGDEEYDDVEAEELAEDDRELAPVTEPEPAPTRGRGAAAASKSPGGSTRVTGGRAGSAAARSEPAPRTAALAAPAAAAPAAAAPIAPAPAEPGTAASAAPSGRGAKVVVIPDRGRFHTESCRFVRDTLGTEELTRTQATRQGYQPCGVCKP